jgi:hypothetical protein
MDREGVGTTGNRIAAAVLSPPHLCSAVVAVIMMLLGDWEHDPEDDSRRKWKHKQLRQPIKWTGPPLVSPQSRVKTLLQIVPTKAEIEEHQRAWNEADNRYLAEQLRKLPLLAKEYGIDTRQDAWIGIASRNDVWVLGVLLALARKVVPGFRLDFGSRRGARKWNASTQAELIADIEAVKCREGRRKCTDLEACHILVSSPRYRPRYGRFSPKQSQGKRARSLNTRLVEARKAKTWVARLLANTDGEFKQLLTDRVISLFTHDPQDAASAKARHDALSKSMALE